MPFNIRSLLNPLKYTLLPISQSLIRPYIDLFALTETWITSSSSSSELSNATPPGFTLISCPRPTPATYPTLLAEVQHFSSVNLLLFFLYLLKPSSHSKCHLSLSNSSNLTLLSSMSIGLLLLPQNLADPFLFPIFSLT